jgi:tripartite-type tricarboxylate transporter receptor subunit TctC
LFLLSNLHNTLMRAPCRLTAITAAFACLTLVASGSHAQPAPPTAGPAYSAYPTKPLRIIVGQTAGGISDLIARMVAQRYTETFKQSAVVENRAGAAGGIGTEMAVKAAPDGYTLLLSSAGPIVINPGLYPKLGYDPLRDLAPIAFVASSPLVLVLHPAVPAKSVKQLIALAAAPDGGVVQKHDRRAHDTRAVQRLGAERDRAGRRTNRSVVLITRDHPAADQSRTHSRTGRDLAAA